MKRYEKPIVEITKFNMADIIATSGEPVVTTMDTTVAKDTDTVTAVQNAGGFDAVGVFNW